jgi:hypothetical protein
MIAWYKVSTRTAPTTATNTLQRLKPVTPVEPRAAKIHPPTIPPEAFARPVDEQAADPSRDGPEHNPTENSHDELLCIELRCPRGDKSCASFAIATVARRHRPMRVVDSSRRAGRSLPNELNAGRIQSRAHLSALRSRSCRNRVGLGRAGSEYVAHPAQTATTLPVKYLRRPKRPWGVAGLSLIREPESVT